METKKTTLEELHINGGYDWSAPLNHNGDTMKDVFAYDQYGMESFSDLLRKNPDGYNPQDAFELDDAYISSGDHPDDLLNALYCDEFRKWTHNHVVYVRKSGYVFRKSDQDEGEQRDYVYGNNTIEDKIWESIRTLEELS